MRATNECYSTPPLPLRSAAASRCAGPATVLASFEYSRFDLTPAHRVQNVAAGRQLQNTPKLTLQRQRVLRSAAKSAGSSRRGLLRLNLALSQKKHTSVSGAARSWGVVSLYASVSRLHWARIGGRSATIARSPSSCERPTKRMFSLVTSSSSMGSPAPTDAKRHTESRAFATTGRWGRENEIDAAFVLVEEDKEHAQFVLLAVGVAEHEWRVVARAVANRKRSVSERVASALSHSSSLCSVTSTRNS